MADVDEILATLDTYAQAYCASDVDALMALFDEDAAISLIGIGKDALHADRKKIRAQFRRGFKSAKTERFEWHWRHVSTSGNAAAVAVSLTVHLVKGGQKVPVQERWTVVLVRRGSGWKWLHMNASIAARELETAAAHSG